MLSFDQTTYLKDNLEQLKTFLSMFTETHFVIMKSQKQYKTPLVEKYAAIEIKEP